MTKTTLTTTEQVEVEEVVHRTMALARLYAAKRFLLSTTALTPMPWMRWSS
jgi:hypothetical protein